MTRGAEDAMAPRPMTAMLMVISTVATPMTGREPNRPTSAPEHRMPIIEPTESPKRMSPICAVDAPSWSRTSGVRVTHDDIDRPGIRKKRNRAVRLRRVSRSIGNGLSLTWSSGTCVAFRNVRGVREKDHHHAPISGEAAGPYCCTAHQ